MNPVKMWYLRTGMFSLILIETYVRIIKVVFMLPWHAAAILCFPPGWMLGWYLVRHYKQRRFDHDVVLA